MTSRYSAKALLLLGVLLAGCSSRGELFPAAGNNPIRIDSVPTGAEVYVMGEKIGTTPLAISSKDVFPNLYPREKESLYGRITLKKPGCSDLTRTVSSGIIGAGLHARLDCNNGTPPSSGIPKEVPDSSASVEQRLDKIKDLLDKGLITDDEAKKARERILNDL